MYSNLLETSFLETLLTLSLLYIQKKLFDSNSSAISMRKTETSYSSIWQRHLPQIILCVWGKSLSKYKENPSKIMVFIDDQPVTFLVCI